MLQQASHHSLDILGSLLFLCLHAFCSLHADGLPSTSTMQKPIITQAQSNVFPFMRLAWLPLKPCKWSYPASSHIATALFRPEVLNQGDSATPRDIWQYIDIFDCQNRELSASSSQLYEADTFIIPFLHVRKLRLRAITQASKYLNKYLYPGKLV